MDERKRASGSKAPTPPRAENEPDALFTSLKRKGPNS